MAGRTHPPKHHPEKTKDENTSVHTRISRPPNTHFKCFCSFIQWVYFEQDGAVSTASLKDQSCHIYAQFTRNKYLFNFGASQRYCTVTYAIQYNNCMLLVHGIPISLSFGS